MQICHKGRELLLDLQRSDWVPYYDDEGVRIVCSEMSTSWNHITTLVSSYEDVADAPDSAKVTLVYHHQCFSRNRRYLQSYFFHRLSRIRALRWETGPVMPDNLRPYLSDRENDYFMEYSSLLSNYGMEMGNLDLTSELEPPKELLIEIRVLRNCGEIMTDMGPINLDAGTTHFLRRTDVETLIRQGMVEHIQSS